MYNFVSQIKKRLPKIGNRVLLPTLYHENGTLQANGSDLVTTDTTQTISGHKTFTGEVDINGQQVLVESDLPTFGQTVLWSGGLYMGDGQTANLSQNVSDQKNGIILVWSRYASGVAKDDSWNYVYVPKFHVQNFAGTGVTNAIGTGTGDLIRKYVYISNDHIAGNSINDDSPNNAQVLRYVLGC